MSPLVEPARWQPFGTGRIAPVGSLADAAKFSLLYLFTLELGNGSLSRLAVLIFLALSLASIQVARCFIRTWPIGRVERYELSEILLLQVGTSVRRLGRAVFQICACCLQATVAVVKHLLPGAMRARSYRTTEGHK